MARTYLPRAAVAARGRTDFEAVLDDPAQLARFFTNGKPTAEFGRFVKDYVDATTADGIEDRVAEIIAGAMTKGGPAARLNLGGRVPQPRNAVHNPQALGTAVDKHFEKAGPLALAEYLRAVAPGDRGDAQMRQTLIANAFSTDTTAGLLVPELIRSEILFDSLEEAIIRPRATVMPMSSLRLGVPAVDGADHSTGSVFGGVTAYWTEEASTLTASSPTFQKIVLEAEKLTLRADVPNELLADAPALQTFIGAAYSSAAAWTEDLAFIAGSGVGEPFGMLNASNPALITVTKESAQAADTIVWENIVAMFARMLPGSLGRAVWLASPDTFPELATMALSVGVGGGPVWIGWGQNGGADLPPVTILGRPLFFTEKVSKLGDAGDVAFVDPRYYLLGDRQAMTMTASEHARFVDDVTVFKLVERVDGRPWLTDPVTPHNGGPTLSAFVRLGERA